MSSQRESFTSKRLLRVSHPTFLHRNIFAGRSRGGQKSSAVVCLGQFGPSNLVPHGRASSPQETKE